MRIRSLPVCYSPVATGEWIGSANYQGKWLLIGKVDTHGHGVGDLIPQTRPLSYSPGARDDRFGKTIVNHFLKNFTIESPSNFRG